jgi:hypothetical protein
VKHPLRFPLQVPPLGSAELIPRQKFTFEYFFTYKKSKDVEHPLRFPLQVPPLGSAELIPRKSLLLSTFLHIKKARMWNIL